MLSETVCMHALIYLRAVEEVAVGADASILAVKEHRVGGGSKSVVHLSHTRVHIITVAAVVGVRVVELAKGHPDTIVACTCTLLI